MSEEDRGQYDPKKDVLVPRAGGALYRKAMLDEIGLSGEGFSIYMEDTNIAFRGMLAGWECLSYLGNILITVAVERPGLDLSYQSIMGIGILFDMPWKSFLQDCC